jgi:endogenous inhibitor of DNA gyrase (YacG/DUF329 family)
MPGKRNLSYPQKNMKENPYTTRNKDIVKLLVRGGTTLASVGKLYHLTRERVRQIYNKTVGKPYTENLKRIRKKKQKQIEKAREIWLDTVHFYCASCKKPVLNRETKGNKKMILCDDCRNNPKIEKRSMHFINTCKTCGNEFHPWANNKTMRFCSVRCYHTRRNEYPEEFRRRNTYREKIKQSDVVFRINGRIIKT